MGGSAIPAEQGPGIMLIYGDDKSSRLVTLSRHMAIDQDKPMIGSSHGWSWAKNAMGYSMVG